jgi:hypothetical protein
MANPFDDDRSSLESPASHVFLITPNDGADLTTNIRAIAFATAGTLKITTLGGETVTIPSGVLAPGIIHPIRVKRVYATGTTVTNIVGVW